MAGRTHEDAAVELKEQGLKVTVQRLAVLEALTRRPHATAEEIEMAARGQLGVISRQAVYDALAALTASGLLRRIEPAGSAARYERRVADNHHHLICRLCGQVVDVDCAVGAVPCLTAADDAGFEIDEAEVTYWGRCPECTTASPDAATRQQPTDHRPNRSS